MIRKYTSRRIIIDLRRIREPLLTPQIIDLILEVIQQKFPQIIMLTILNVILKFYLAGNSTSHIHQTLLYIMVHNVLIGTV